MTSIVSFHNAKNNFILLGEKKGWEEREKRKGWDARAFCQGWQQHFYLIKYNHIHVYTKILWIQIMNIKHIDI